MGTEKILIEQQADLAIISTHNPPANSLDVHTLKELDFSIRKFGMAEKISQKGQVAVRSVLEFIWVSADFRTSEGMERETRLFGKLFETEDAKEGIAAFLGKRKPNFTEK